jgi:hypothetical protein
MCEHRRNFAEGANDGNATDCDGHGTHVASTAAGRAVGVAKEASVIAVRVLDCDGSGQISDVVAGERAYHECHIPSRSLVMKWHRPRRREGGLGGGRAVLDCDGRGQSSNIIALCAPRLPQYQQHLFFLNGRLSRLLHHGLHVHGAFSLLPEVRVSGFG